MSGDLDITPRERPRVYHAQACAPEAAMMGAVHRACRHEYGMAPLAARLEPFVPQDSYELRMLPSDADRVRKLKGVFSYLWCFKAV